MAWPTPKYSKNQVNRAGRIFADLRTTLPSPIDQFWWALEVLENWRSCHSYPINTFQATLRQKLKPIETHAIVAQRLKRLPSIIRKLQRFKNMQLARMQDIGGLRAVVSTLNKVRLLADNYRKSQFSHELVAFHDYIAFPKTSGYRGVHLIYRYMNPRSPEYDGLLLELQIRTRLQHTWATAVETVGTFLNHALKSSEGPETWLNFFSLTGSAFAYLENSPPVPGYDGLTKEETFTTVIKKAHHLRVKDKLLTFSIAAERVHTDSKIGRYHLLILDPNEKKVTISTYSQNNLQEASRDYSEVERTIAERKIDDGEPIQAVLVSAGPIKNLRRAYPNYFLDTHEFVKQLDRIERQTLERDPNPRQER